MNVKYLRNSSVRNMILPRTERSFLFRQTFICHAHKENSVCSKIWRKDNPWENIVYNKNVH